MFAVVDRDYRFVLAPGYVPAARVNELPGEAPIVTYDGEVSQAALLTCEAVLILIASQWLLAEVVVPRSQRALTAWWASLPPPKDESADTELLWFKSGGVVIGVAHAQPDGRQLDGVRIFRRDAKGHLLSRTIAASAHYAERQWMLSDAVITDFSLHSVSTPVATLPWNTSLRPSDVQRLVAAEPYVSGGLAAAVLTGASSGVKTPAFYLTRVQKVWADPIIALVMLLLATPVAVALTRVSKAGPTLIALGSGLLFLLSHGLSAALGEAGLITPLIAAWAAPALFGMLGLTFLFRLDRHQ